MLRSNKIGMTIIRPRKENYVLKYLLGGLVSTFILVSICGVFFYNKFVSNRHEVSRYKTIVREVEIKNAELKDNYYKLTNSEKINEIYNSSGLFIEKNPEYVKKQQMVMNNQ